MKKIILSLVMVLITTISFSQITLTVSSTPVSCYGGSNGSATVTVSGGTGPYTFTWTPTGSNSATLSLVTSGVYTVTVEDATAATATATVNIAQPTALVSTPSTTNVTCFGMCNGAATALVNGGTTPYIYLWGSTPTQTTQTATNLCAGAYTVQVTDANNCVTISNFSLSQPTPLNVFASSNNASCGGTCDGSVFTQASGGTPAYTYSWSAGGFFGPFANGLCPGMYSVNVIDANGCIATATAVVNSTGTGSLSGVTTTLTSYNESCYLSGDGAIDLELGGTNPGPFTYQWNTGASTQDLTNLSTSYYTVIIFDASMNCMSVSDTVTFDGTNCGTIDGNVFMDNNADCINNSGDNNYQYASIMVNPGNRWAYTDMNGNYTLNNLPYGTYSITLNTYNGLVATCTTTINTTINSGSPNSINNNLSAGFNSAFQPDMQVSAYSNGIVPGFVCHMYYYLSNLNNVNGSGLFKAKLPSPFIPAITGATPAGYTISGDTVIWSFSNITYSSGSQIFHISFTTPLTTTLGSTFTSCAYAQTSITDFNPANNTYCYSRMVTGSFDPNDKGVTPMGTGPSGNISVNDTELTYLIRFQNTGNGPAVNIVVKDTISTNLDISTFQMLNASHTYAVDILPGNVLRWKFDNIMLVDSNTNEPASHGFIQYRIKRGVINTIGTEIKNTAYIYFDFNDPVITNTTLNTIAADPVSVMSLSKNENDWLVYPNPNSGTLYLINNTPSLEESQIQIVNAMGQVVHTETTSSNRKAIDLSKLNNGVYFVKISSDTHNSVKRIVLSK